MHLLELSWPGVKELPRDTPVVIPIAAVEQHGHHLPVYTDSFLLGEVVRRAYEKVGDKVLLTPLQWLGNSEHHLDFPGTMTASPRVYLDLLRDLVGNFLFHGFRTIVLLNGHGGNIVPSQQALFEVRQQNRPCGDLKLIALTYWNSGPSPAEAIPGLVQREMGHACEWETSMMLRLRPDLVGDHRAAHDVSQFSPAAPGQQAWITKDRSPVGHIGRPSQASADKGEQLFAHFSGNVARYLEGLCAMG